MRPQFAHQRPQNKRNMNETKAAVENFLKAGDFQAAWSVFDNLRPNLRFGMEGVILTILIHSAAKRWSEVGVLCRVLRKEYPDDPSGFTHGADALYEQGRIADAIQLLGECPASATNPQILTAMERYQAALSIPEKAAA